MGTGSSSVIHEVFMIRFCYVSFNLDVERSMHGDYVMSEADVSSMHGDYVVSEADVSLPGAAHLSSVTHTVSH